MCATLATLTGCAQQTQITPAGARPSNRGGAVSDASWMASGATSQNLLYVSDLSANDVAVYSYPSGALIGKLTGFGSVAGVCADKAGDVFVVDEAGAVQVFAHGGKTPIRKLTTTGAPYGCAVDPVTGDLALTNLSAVLYGAIAIYPKAKGSPKEYTDNAVDSTFFCGYETNGDLFCDGWDRSANPILLKLPKQGKSLTTFKLNPKNTNPGGVQWDGKYVAVGSRGAGLVYRINPSSGGAVQTITLKNGTYVNGFWIEGAALIGPNWQAGGTVPFWHYPGGGSPTKTLTGFSYPFGATVSLAK
jgi:hypothetical protein